ncbi:MAG TPA: lytic transglycosylase domain-containing protein [Anaerolineaceae bacterium]|nr:lytic transglycosylase domain-containing protein [Anaerolineaceae bacterium]
MISFSKIILGFLTGSTLLILTATQLFSTGLQVSASAEEIIVEDTILESVIVINECSISASYPASIQQWCSDIELFAMSYELDPNLIAAVMLQESGGDPNAYSKSGAVGLMQIMPRDGIAASFNCINGPCFSNRPSIEELYNPQFNIEFGVKMLKSLFGKFGNWRDALKAYGPMDMGYGYADIVLSIYNNY